MVHNGIEYGLMAAYAEGFNILKHANVGTREARGDAPRRRRCAIRSTTSTTSICRRSPKCGGTAASSSSWLLDLTACGARQESRRSTHSAAACRIRAKAAGRSTRRSTKACRPTCSPPRCSRASRSRGEADFQNRLLSAMRFEFGGHVEKKPTHEHRRVPTPSSSSAPPAISRSRRSSRRCRR